MTATSISKRMTAAGLPNKIGVTTGEAFCGNVGSYKRCEYALYGDVVNTAARFMANKANDGILVCETTMKSCMARVVFSDAKVLKLKGKDDLVNAYTPVYTRKLRRGGKSRDSTSSTECDARALDEDDGSECSRESLDGFKMLKGGGCSTLGDPGLSGVTRKNASPTIMEREDDDKNIGVEGKRRDGAGAKKSILGRVSRSDKASFVDGEGEMVGHSPKSAMRPSSATQPDGCRGEEGVHGVGGGSRRSGGNTNRFVGRVAERVMLCGKIDAVAATGDGQVIVIEAGSSSFVYPSEAEALKKTLFFQHLNPVKHTSLILNRQSVLFLPLRRGRVWHRQNLARQRGDRHSQGGRRVCSRIVRLLRQL